MDFISNLDTAYAWLRALIEQGDAKLVVADEDFRMRCLSPSAALFIGKRPDEFVGRTVEEVMPLGLAVECRRIGMEVLRDGKAQTVEEALHGWRCEMFFFPAGTADGRRLIGVLLRPRSLQLPEVAGSRRPFEADKKESALGALATLSRMELQVLSMIGEGRRTRDIAEKLGRAVKTVEGHRFQLGKKLGVTNRVVLARIAICAGLTPLRPLLQELHGPEGALANGHGPHDDDED